MAIKNPLLHIDNGEIDFEYITAENVHETALFAIDLAHERVKLISNIPRQKRTFENTMQAMDTLFSSFGDVYNIVYLLANVAEKEILRETCREAFQEMSKTQNEISMHDDLYNSVMEYIESEEVKQLTSYKKKYVDDFLSFYRLNGFMLDEEKRRELMTLNQEIIRLSTLFNQNSNAHKDSIIVHEADVKGLPEMYRNAHRNEQGSYSISLAYSSFQPFMTYSPSAEKRQELYIKYLNRAADKNTDILAQLVGLRKEKAKILGFDSYAAYKVVDKMAQNTANVWNFEKDIAQKLRIKAQQDYEALVEIKKQHTQNEQENEIFAWELSFYRNLLTQQKYELNQENIKEYFTLDNVLLGLFKLCKQLFGLRIKEAEEPSVWHQDARLFNVFDGNTLIGRFYTDFFPREHKINSPASFCLVAGRQISPKEYRTPVAVMIGNFPRPTAEYPSLLSFAQVNTIFHEFGHILHIILTTSPLGAMAGTKVSRDYTEVHSALMEHWLLEYDVIQSFAKHYQEGDTLPYPLFNRLKESQNATSGIDTLQQVLYGTYDFYLHDLYEENKDGSVSQVLHTLQNEISLFPAIPNTHFEAGFGHLIGYAAGYYGYLWAQVYAADIFSLFKEKDIFDTELGKRLREEIFSRGSTIEELEQILRFLQREPSLDAFILSLGV